MLIAYFFHNNMKSFKMQFSLAIYGIPKNSYIFGTKTVKKHHFLIILTNIK